MVTKVAIHSLYYKFPNINLEIIATLKSWLVAMKLLWQLAKAACLVVLVNQNDFCVH